METKIQEPINILEVLENKLSIWKLDRDNDKKKHKSQLSDLIDQIKNIKNNGGCSINKKE